MSNAFGLCVLGALVGILIALFGTYRNLDRLEDQATEQDRRLHHIEQALIGVINER